MAKGENRTIIYYTTKEQKQLKENINKKLLKLNVSAPKYFLALAKKDLEQNGFNNQIVTN